MVRRDNVTFIIGIVMLLSVAFFSSILADQGEGADQDAVMTWADGSGTTWYYSLDENNDAELVQFRCSTKIVTHLSIPSIVDGYSVSKIGKDFYNKSSQLNQMILQKITIPNTVVEIGPYAFSGIKTLATVEFETGSSLERISDYAFNESYNDIQTVNNLRQQYLDAETIATRSHVEFDLISSKWNAREKVGQHDVTVTITSVQTVQSITLNPGNIAVTDYTFENNTVTLSFDVSMFGRCNILLQGTDTDGGTEGKQFVVIWNNFLTASKDVIYNYTDEISFTATSSYVNGRTEEYTGINLKEKTLNNGYYWFYLFEPTEGEIKQAKFSVNKLTFFTVTFNKVLPLDEFTPITTGFSLELPPSVEIIGKNALNKAQYVYIPDSSMLKTIGDGSLASVNNKVSLPSSVTYIGALAINNLAEVEISDDNTSYMIQEGYLTTRDGTHLLSYHGDAESISFRESIQTVDDYAFKGKTAIKKVILRDGITFGVFPFEDTGVEEIDLSKTTSIPDYIFKGTKIQKLTIPSNVETIGYKSFYLINTLEEVEFANGSKITDIGSYSFSSNDNLKVVSFGSSSPGYSCSINTGAFFACGSLINIMIDPNFNLISIGDGAFAKNVNNLLDVSEALSFGMESGILIPSSVESIGKGAFSASVGGIADGTTKEPYRRMMQASITFTGMLNAPNWDVKFAENSRINQLNTSAFAGLRGTKLIDLSNCTSLLTIPERLCHQTYGTLKTESGWKQAFETDIRLPPNITEIGKEAFRVDITDLTYASVIEIPPYVEKISYAAFNGSAKEISFKEGSLLTDASNILRAVPDQNYILNLGNCLHLKSVQIYYTTILPQGVYSIDTMGYNAWIKESEKVLLNLENDNVLKITSDTTAINKDVFQNVSTVEISDDNPFFSIEKGTLIYEYKNERVIEWVLKGIKSIELGEELKVSKIAEAALSGTDVKVVRISPIADGEMLILDDKMAEGCDGITYIFECELSSLSMSGLTFASSTSNRFCIDGSGDATIESWLKSFGTIYKNRCPEDNISIFLPETVSGIPVEYGGISYSDDKLIISSIKIKGGYTAYDLSFDIDGEPVKIIEGKLFISAKQRDSKILSITISNRTSDDMVSIKFFANGGSIEGYEHLIVKIPRGMTLIDSDLPVATYGGHSFDMWVDSSNNAFDTDSPITRDIVLTATWKTRNPIITLDIDSGDVYYKGNKVTSVTVDDAEDSVEFTFASYDGYQPFYWIIDGKRTDKLWNEALVLNAVSKDITIEMEYVFSATSSVLQAYNNRGLPTGDELSTLVKVSELGGDVDTSGYFWSGHSSVPLVMDGYVYFRAIDRLYMAESDTGYVLKAVESMNDLSYYHYLGYGDGVILDYATGKAYNTNLEQLYVIEKGAAMAVYHDGYFYTLGKNVYRFTATDDDTSRSDETKPVELIGIMEGAFAGYGIPGCAFVGDYIYRVYASGDERGFIAMNLTTGETNVQKVDALKYYYLDDGWLTYHDGTLYLTGYTYGLFDAKACDDDDVVAFVDVDGLNFKNLGSVKLDGERYFMSKFLVYDDIGFVNSGGMIHVYDIKSGNNGKSLIQKDIIGPSAFSHGSMVMDTSRVKSEGIIGFYTIPYYSNKQIAMSIVEYDLKTGASASYISTELPYNYNSQAVRSDVEGRMIWYNDSGHIFTYTTPEKNRFFFFIEDEGVAQWYESYGATAADALKALGSDVVTLTASNGLDTMFGEDAYGWNLYYLKQDVLGYQNPRTDPNGWKKIDNLFDTKLNSYHYYAITTSDTAPASTDYRFVDGSDIGTYTFADNVGDRSIVGKKLIAAADVFTIRFYDGDEEIGNSTLIGAMGSKVDGTFPSVYKADHIANWYVKGTDDRVTELPKTFSKDLEYEVRWVKAEYALKATVRTVGDTVFFEFSAEAKSGWSNLVDARVLLHAKYGNAFFTKTFSGELDLVNGRSTAMLGVSSSDLSYVVAYLVEGTPTTDRYSFYAEYIHEAGA